MNKYPPHVVQSEAWGDFKAQMGTPAVRVGNLQYTLHPIPFTKLKVGYCPKPQPEDIDLQSLYDSGKERGCSHIKIDVPNTEKNYELRSKNYEIIPSKPTFATATFMLDLTKPEEELLQEMHSKTRYNLNLAKRKGVVVAETDDIEIFLKLQRETAERQHFHVHPDTYYKTIWKMFQPLGMAHLLVASLDGEALSSYFLMKYQNTFYYPYGGSTDKHKDVMANNLIMWEAVKLGQKLGCQTFDLWGALPNPVDVNDAWYGFHRFKEGFGAEHVEFPGAWDLVIRPLEYKLFKTIDTLRWKLMNRT